MYGFGTLPTSITGIGRQAKISPSSTFGIRSCSFERQVLSGLNELKTTMSFEHSNQDFRLAKLLEKVEDLQTINTDLSAKLEKTLAVVRETSLKTSLCRLFSVFGLFAALFLVMSIFVSPAILVCISGTFLLLSILGFFIASAMRV